jgi:phospholipid transport system substrate-binding protein
MNVQLTEPGIGGFATSLDPATDGVTPSLPGLPRGVSEALADPIVRAVMAADRLDPKAVEALLRGAGARLAPGDLQQGPSRGAADEGRPKPRIGTALAQLAKGVALTLAVLAGLSAAPAPAMAEAAPTAFIRALGDQAVSVIRSAMPLTSKAAYFDQMVRQDFDLNGICRFVLGPYWRVASAAERQQFADGFVDRLVRFYGRQLAQSGDGDFVVTGSRTEPDGAVVTSRIIRPQGAPIAVDWRLGVSDGLYKIEDVAIDGISMALTQRFQISQLMARDGGQLGTLLVSMRAQ